MYSKQVVAITLMLASAAAVAQTTLKTVVVRASSAETVQMSCSDPAVSVQDAQRVLAIKDPAQVNTMRKQLIDAASAACKADVPRIQVARAGGKSLSWKAAD